MCFNRESLVTQATQLNDIKPQLAVCQMLANLLGKEEVGRRVNEAETSQTMLDFFKSLLMSSVDSANEAKQLANGLLLAWLLHDDPELAMVEKRQDLLDEAIKMVSPIGKTESTPIQPVIDLMQSRYPRKNTCRSYAVSF